MLGKSIFGDILVFHVFSTCISIFSSLLGSHLFLKSRPPFATSAWDYRRNSGSHRIGIFVASSCMAWRFASRLTIEIRRNRLAVVVPSVRSWPGQGGSNGGQHRARFSTLAAGFAVSCSAAVFAISTAYPCCISTVPTS